MSLIIGSAWLLSILPGLFWSRYIYVIREVQLGPLIGAIDDSVTICAINKQALDSYALLFQIATTMLFFIIPAIFFPAAYKQ